VGEAVIFRGGPIETFGPGPNPDAVLVEDGRIAALGTSSECRDAAASAPRVVDLGGRTLAPGFVDAHAHLLLHGCRLDWADLTGARSIDEIVDRLRAYGAAHPDRDSRFGYGYDQTVLREARHPAAADLDRVDAARPVAVQHISGHGYVVNSAIMRDAGISAATPTPAGGRIDRDEGGEPTGLFFDAACDLLTGEGGVKIRNHGPNFHLPMPPEDLHRRFRLAQESFLSVGITTICDAQVSELELAAYLAARDQDRLFVRAQLLLLSSGLEHLRGIGLSSRIGDPRLEISGVKFYADGSVLAGTAFLEGECCGHDGATGAARGYLYHDPHELVDLLGSAHRLGLPTATHAQGSVPIGIVVDALEAARAERPRPGLRHRIEHCGFPTDSQLARMAAAGIVPVSQPVQLHEHADEIVELLGPVGGRFYPYGAFARAGLPVVISSDAPVTDPNPLEAAWAAITRRSVSGRVAGGAELRIDRAAALAGISTAPADLLGRADVGSLAVGKAADLVLLDADPVTADVDALPSISVSETWIAGEPVWSAGYGLVGAERARALR